LLLAGFVAYRCCNHWELAIDSRADGLVLNFHERCGNRVQTVILDGVRGSITGKGSYRLPEEVGSIPGAILKFSDITMRPGRVTFSLLEHSFDITERVIIIDGHEYSWNIPGEIHLNPLNTALQSNRSKRHSNTASSASEWKKGRTDTSVLLVIHGADWRTARKTAVAPVFV
jgi:hypothetical protein